MADIATIVLQVVSIFILGFGVRLVAVHSENIVYPVALVLIGVTVAFTPFELGISLSRDFIMIGFLPILLFQGAAELELGQVRDLPLAPLAMVFVGLPLTAGIIGLAGSWLFDIPLLIALLFGAIIAPTDPAAVLAVFQQLEAPADLETIIKSESVFNDTVSIVLFTVLLDLVLTQQETGNAVTQVTGVDTVVRLLVEMLIVGGGGLLVGAVVGFGVYGVTRVITDRMATLLLTVIAAYGSYIVASQFLGISGVLAAVTAGLVIGHTGKWDTRPSETVLFMKGVWQTAVFLINTLIYILIGELITPGTVFEYVWLIVGAAVLVLVARILVVYPTMGGINQLIADPLPIQYQHVIVWGSLHTVIPVALALSLPEGMPFYEEIRTMVFGVAVLSVGVQGLLMPAVLKLTGISN
ncbi:sodium:proton antiporter [Halonotius terrestris]|jgi:CPA1 family monovalent cation:H+ antiporter|uniref:Sodium:proton antiporter n=1 Tax=Halonotius terrestris TaxID=2487750 RepID=A0A8J8P7Y3_9EURY|nr:sodium:proton antiporter [Halonotius terrestris]TQQ78737.1 sodium:proton antiporter [Halonotius terrestris]